ncbi:MAG: glycogen debranching protein GlgX [Methylobacteriaceae bacterium]|jgi:glycogen operon protein|nr:glycogen debranching protein GlgX [Methylobacteriaceae bacterium]
MAETYIGSAEPPGSHYDGKGVNFSLFSARADKVELCLFDDSGRETRQTLPGRSGPVWHGYIPGLTPGTRYNYRVHGPWNPWKGLQFNPNKLLIDPRARLLDADVRDHPALYDPAADTAPFIPKSIVAAPTPYDWEDDRPPRTPWGRTIIYEAHVRGLTKLHPAVPEALRGSYAALAHPEMLSYFKELGVTALELLPVQLHTDEPRLQALGLSNYWGYNVLAPFALETRYGSGLPGTSAHVEFKDAVKALHRAGIEVILDIVLNHTAELDDVSPTLCQRGIDNESYYWLEPSGKATDWTGCGNTLRLTSAEVIRWARDCLHFWVQEYHIDGFRFDLGAILGRTPGFSAGSPFLEILRRDPVLSRLKLIMEPWDATPEGYSLGRFSAPFGEWNDLYRNDMRRFWLLNQGTLGGFAMRFAASADVFDREGRAPGASINFLASHDGFTLKDTVSYEHKHNEANGEENRDGCGVNWSCNYGVEGDDAPEAVARLRVERLEGLLAILFLSQGTPMLLAGDEWGNSQNGNNNSYCQDNRISWLNWDKLNRELLDFTRRMISIRKRIPALNSDLWWKTGRDVRWLNRKGVPLTPDEWQSQSEKTLQIELSRNWLVVVNASDEPVSVTLPDKPWRIAVSDVSDREPAGDWPSSPKSISLFVCTES